LGRRSGGLTLRRRKTTRLGGPHTTDSSPEREQEQAVLVKLITPANAAETDARNPLGELKALAEAAGAQVVDGLIQKRTTPDGRRYRGKGKAEELAARVQANEANLVIFDDELLPSQIRSLEKITGCRVIDRSELILDIFAARAQTHEARLQVEIAQLEYTSPRLRGMWTHLERIAGAGGASSAGVVGGIGTRGPGERQVEIDRRIVRDRLALLRREIERIDQRKLREVHSRSDQFTISLVGYTNAGKSTLMNALTGAGQDTRDMLFATLDTRTARWNLGGGSHVLLSDTVGFVRNLPHHLVASFRATLEEALHADLLCHVVDASVRGAVRQMEVVKGVLAELGCADKPTLTVLNKIDRSSDEALLDVLSRKSEPSLAVSARTGEGLERLAEYVSAAMQTKAVRLTLRADAGDGRLITLVGQLADVHDRTFVDDRVGMDVTIDRAKLGQLRARYETLEIVDPKARPED